MQFEETIDLAVIGGGAAGFMGAIKAAEDGVSSVFIFEATEKTLEKVRISGGGRCNVTNACWDPADLVINYPRGELPLKGAFSHFAAGDAVAWFEERNLQLIIEEDGRMFPKSNSSKDVMKCLENAAIQSGVVIKRQMSVKEVIYSSEKGFLLKFRNASKIYSKKVLLATGSNPTGKKIASALGHIIIPPVPSLFSFKIVPNDLVSCAGISVNNVKLKIFSGNKNHREIGRILITHKGLSGPAVLKLSAFAARDLYANKYNASLEINWVNNTYENIIDLLVKFRNDFPSSTLIKTYPFNRIPKRLWIILLEKIGVSPYIRWSELSNNAQRALTIALEKSSYKIIGKGPSGDEFVTAGGVSLKQVNFKSMQSRICNGLYFAGEVLDIDGVTGGFNFQSCWTSGWISGQSIAQEIKAFYKN